MAEPSEFVLRTTRTIERRDITKDVANLAEAFGSASAILVSVPHTTAAVTIGEAWDPDVTGDIERALDAWVPNVRFEHGEGNSAAHFLSEAIGVSCLVPCGQGKLLLGRWQGVFLIELDGPRDRTVRVAPIGG